MSTKQLTVPSSVFDGKENSILRKENNKTILTYKNCQGGMAKIHLICYVAHSLTSKIFLLLPWSPFSFFFVLSVAWKIDLSRITWESFLLHLFQNFTMFTMHNEEFF